MSRLWGGWYILVALLVLAPVGVRALTRAAPRKHVLETDTVQAGKELFEHEWKVNDPLANGGDGLGPVFNATSCVACHFQGGVGGGGGLQHNVTAFSVDPAVRGGKVREGVIHAQATSPRYQETLANASPELPKLARPTLNQIVAGPGKNDRLIQTQPSVHLSQRNTPALFGARLIDEMPDHVIIAGEKAQRVRAGMAPLGQDKAVAGRALRLAGGRVGKFGWKAQSASLGDFVRAACANELGLGNPGQAQPTPMSDVSYIPPGLDLTDRQCDQMTTFIASLERPRERVPADPLAAEQSRLGKKLFNQIGCAECHTPNLGSVEGIYSDLLLHPMGGELQGSGSYNEPSRPPDDPTKPEDNARPSEWRTPPLWGVADSAPYLHDGRAATLEAAIKEHAGQGAASAARFNRLGPVDQACLVTFLKTLRAP